MDKSSRPSAFFIADHLALDLLNSIAALSASTSEFEWLANGEDLLKWLELAELVPTAVSKSFRDNTEMSELNVVAEQARELREWFRSFIKINAGKPIESSKLNVFEPVNQILANDNGYHQLQLSTNNQESSQFYLQLNRQWDTPESLLIPLAEIIADLICQADFNQIKNCEGPTCTLWFHDISKNHGRRWCSMAVCGNRAKAAAHRAKKQSARNNT